MFISFHIDNAVFQVHTLHGQSTIDTLNIAGFQKQLSTTMSAVHTLELDQGCRTQTLDKKNVFEKLFIKLPTLKQFKLPNNCTSEEYGRLLNFSTFQNVCLPWLLCKTLAAVVEWKLWINTDTELNIKERKKRNGREGVEETNGNLQCSFFLLVMLILFTHATRIARVVITLPSCGRQVIYTTLERVQFKS